MVGLKAGDMVDGMLPAAIAGSWLMVVDPRGSEPGTRLQPAAPQAPTPAVAAVNRIIRCILQHMGHLVFRVDVCSLGMGRSATDVHCRLHDRSWGEVIPCGTKER